MILRHGYGHPHHLRPHVERTRLGRPHGTKVLPQFVRALLPVGDEAPQPLVVIAVNQILPLGRNAGEQLPTTAPSNRHSKGRRTEDCADHQLSLPAHPVIEQFHVAQMSGTEFLEDGRILGITLEVLDVQRNRSGILALQQHL